jgi:hypothetical protein
VLVHQGKLTRFHRDTDQQQVTVAQGQRQDAPQVFGDYIGLPLRMHQDFLLPRLGLGARCESALAAAVLLALLVLPSRRTFDAALAAFALVRLCFAILVSLRTSEPQVKRRRT